jgi:dihydroorotate dehydrogenase
MTNIGKVVWPGPVGIAAGLIKGSAAFLDFATMADAIEIGSITKDVCHGNTGQTIWRYKEEDALRHYAGMPNPGSLEIVNQLIKAQEQIQIPWGINVATTPGISDTASAVIDITTCIQNILSGRIHPDWLTLNVSSPDTVDHVDMLAEPQRVWALIKAIKPLLSAQSIPLWLKLGATLPKTTYSQLGKLALEEHIDALICSNATPDPNGLPGGWCGRALKAPSIAALWELQQVTSRKIPIVSVGGILTGTDVAARLQAGASAVQIASALLLRGRNAASLLHREHELLASTTTH